MTASRYASVVANGRQMVHVPFAMGGIGVFHSVPTSTLGGAALDLTGCLLAKIFSRQITMWNDPQILALNPSLTYTGEIKVVHRVRGSSSTAGFTEYLAGKCPASWSLGSGSTITWPAGTFEAQGSGGMAGFIAANEGAIGYIDAGHGHAANLGEVALQNADGQYLTMTTADISAAGTLALASGTTIPSDPSVDFSSLNLSGLSGPTTWPITMISYFYLEQDWSSMDPTSAGLLDYFVKFILSAEGQALAVDNMFVGLPQALLDYNTATLSTITKPLGMPTFTTETAANTLPQIGAGEYVISGKRRSYDEVMATENQAAIEALETRVAAVETGASSAGSVDDADDSVKVMHGAGTTNPSKLFWESMQLITERARLPLKLTYRAVGSSTGQKEFLGDTNNYTALSARRRLAPAEPPARGPPPLPPLLPLLLPLAPPLVVSWCVACALWQTTLARATFR